MTLREGPRITTRLADEDYNRFLQAVIANKTTVSQLARDAMCFYLDHLDSDRKKEYDSQLETRIKKMEDRLAGLLARANIDVGVIINLMYARMNVQTREEEIKAAHAKSAQRLRRKAEVIEKLKDLYIKDTNNS